ncbi:M48 family metalloprotease [Mariniblastus fucicola]|uniref:Uncharacterized protein n=1 Tax=Mariniblastus fucicola TaxID=980251 RepID=A0A5B9P7K0_9BACT|nr:hypothetical protein [Mariniblastus fucicola]QEG20922.1 hypothetical protein MFFC18_07730 [Mariniblastus fucicola]
MTRRMTRMISGLGTMLLSISGMIAFHSAELTAQTIREVAVPGMRGIASVGYRGNTLTVEYNPRTCARLGPELCSFFRAHEYGHIALRHLERGTPVRQAEYEADQWAARNTSPAARAAAIRYFQSGSGGSRRHGSANSRAYRVASAGTSARTRVAVRPDGSRTVKRGYHAVAQRPFNTGMIQPLFRRRVRQ